MRILQVSTRDVGGGAEQVAMSLHRGYRARCHDAVLAVGSRLSDEPGTIEMDNSAARGLAGRVERLALRVDKRVSARAAWPIHATSLAMQPRRFVERVLGREDFEMPASRRVLDALPWTPDVVHCHNLHGAYFDLRQLTNLSRSAPTFLTLHDEWSFTGHCAYALGCARWRTGCGSCPDLTIYPPVMRDATRHNLERKRDIYRRSTLYVAAPSRWLLDEARASVLAAGVREFRHIPHGVDLGTFNANGRAAARARIGVSSDARVVLFAAAGAGASPFKDYATIAEAVRRASERYRGEDLLLLVVGAHGPLRTEGRTRFVPFVKDRSAVADYYRSADCFVHAAAADNFPNTVLEAQACGTPVIATAVGGIPEQIEDGATGILVPPRGAAEMAEAIVTLLGDPVRLTAMQRRAAVLARERYDIERHIADYCSWFEEVRARQAPGAAS